MADFYLASASPRRREFLQQLGYRFEVRAAAIAEHPAPNQSPQDYAVTIASAKAMAVWQATGQTVPVLAADTDVSLDGQILGKPDNEAHAIDMLLSLANRWHEVHTAIALASTAGLQTVLVSSRVALGAISRQEAAWYWQTQEPQDKAGGYAIQGLAGQWIRRIEGSYSGIVGLPLLETCSLLAAHGIYGLNAIADSHEH